MRRVQLKSFDNGEIVTAGQAVLGDDGVLRVDPGWDRIMSGRQVVEPDGTDNPPVVSPSEPERYLDAVMETYSGLAGWAEDPDATDS